VNSRRERALGCAPPDRINADRARMLEYCHPVPPVTGWQYSIRLARDHFRPTQFEAVEVADRWHLWHNFAEAVEKTVAAHHYCLRKEPEIESEPSTERTTSEELLDARRRRESVIRAVTLKKRGRGIDAIARQLVLAGETVRRFYYASRVDELLGTLRAGCLPLADEFAVRLDEHFNDGCTSVAALYEEFLRIGISR